MVKVWNVETGEVLWTAPGQGGYNQLSYSPDGRFLAVTRPSHTAVLEASSGRVLTSDDGWGPRFLGDGGRIVTSDGNSAKVWDTLDGQLLVALRVPGESYSVLGTSPDGRRLATATVDGDIRVWDAPPEEDKTGEEIRVLGGASEPFSAVAFRPDGRELAATSKDGTARVWDVGSGQERFVVRGHGGQLFDVAYSPDGWLLASAGMDKEIRIWDAEAGGLVRALPGLDHPPVGAVQFSADGSHLLAKTSEQILVWDLAGERWASSVFLTYTIGNMARDPRGRYLVIPLGHRGLRVCDAKSGRSMRDVQYGAEAYCVAFHPDGRWLASAGSDRTITLRESRGWTRVRTLRGHDTNLWGVAFHPGGRWLASGGADGMVVLWDPFTGEIVRTLKGALGEVRRLAFSPDGRWLAAASGIRGRGEVVVWDLTRLDLTAEAREQAARDHSEGQRLAGLKRSDEALVAYQKALAVRGRLAREDPENSRVRRDLATTFGGIAEVHVPPRRRGRRRTTGR
jgi:WD40 repeat protein